MLSRENKVAKPRDKCSNFGSQIYTLKYWKIHHSCIYSSNEYVHSTCCMLGQCQALETSGGWTGLVFTLSRGSTPSEAAEFPAASWRLIRPRHRMSFLFYFLYCSDSIPRCMFWGWNRLWKQSWGSSWPRENILHPVYLEGLSREPVASLRVVTLSPLSLWLRPEVWAC